MFVVCPTISLVNCLASGQVRGNYRFRNFYSGNGPLAKTLFPFSAFSFNPLSTDLFSHKFTTHVPHEEDDDEMTDSRTARLPISNAAIKSLLLVH